jgi:hypothetical protein
MMKLATAFLTIFLSLPALATAPASQPSFTPTSNYTRKEIRGWTVLVNNDLLSGQPKVADKVLELLDAKLLDLTRVVPAAAVEKLQHVPIWLELNNPKVPGGCYHPSREWLVGHDFNPEKAKAVEFGNAKNFLTWSREQPNLVLHEMAHAYHDQVLGFDNPEIRKAFDKAKEEGLYESVLRINGHKERAYAMNTVQEYFAELSEAYFGTNDFYPFVKAEVKEHDPRMYALLEKVWGK